MSDSDNPPNAASNITQVCTKCGRKFPATVEYFTKLKGGNYGLNGEFVGQNVRVRVRTVTLI